MLLEIDLAGGDLEQRIDENLEWAEIILLLISANFIASEYCYEKEMTRALERQNKGEAQVIPVIILDCNWRLAPFKNLNALSTNGLAVTNWPDRDSAWRNVSEGIEKEVEKIQRKSG